MLLFKMILAENNLILSGNKHVDKQTDFGIQLKWTYKMNLSYWYDNSRINRFMMHYVRDYVYLYECVWTLEH